MNSREMSACVCELKTPMSRCVLLTMLVVWLLATFGQASDVQAQQDRRTQQSDSVLADDDAADAVEPMSFRVMSFNIRFNNPRDGANAWPNRKDHVAGIIRDYQADIVGLQEALPLQLSDLEARLDDFAWYGVGRNDGQAEGHENSGEFSAVFYRKDRFELKNSGTFWLAETPEKPGSKSWDAALPRICSWVELQDKQSEQTVFAFNTHFDHVGETARQRSAELLLREIPKIAGNAPFVLTGDFNAAPDSKPYQILTNGVDGGGEQVQPLRDAVSISQEPAKGPDSTWNGFRRITPGRRIDYVFLPMDRGSVKSIEAIDKTFEGRFPSDHLPVVAEVVFEN